MIDTIFAILMIIAVIKGLRKGLVVALFSIIAYIIGLAAALKLSAAVAVYLEKNVAVPGKWLPVISFAVVFMVVVIAVNLGGRIIEKSFEMAFLGMANKLAGAAIYVVLYTLIFSIILFFAEKIHLLQPEAFAQSAIWPYVRPWGPIIMDSFGKIIPLFRDMFTGLEEFFGNIAAAVHPK